MDLLTEEKMRVLLLKERSKPGASFMSQCEDMKMGYHTLVSWNANIVRYPGKAQCTSMKILQYLQERGYLTITIHKEPIKVPF